MDVREWLARELLVAGPVRVRGSDALLAAAVVVVGLVEVATGLPWQVTYGSPLLFGALVVALGVALLGRSSVPVTSALLVQLALPLWVMVAMPSWFAYQLGAYLVSVLALGAHAPLRRAVPAMTAIVGTWCVAAWLTGRPADGPASVMLPLFAFAMGLVLGRRAEDRDRARMALVQAEAERDLRVRAAVSAERLLVARDLHDAVAHQVTVMVMHAGAVRRLLGPAQSSQREALSDVEEVGREAVGDMHRIVSALRDGQDPAPLPADLSRLAELVAQARRIGAEIVLDAGDLEVSDLPLAVSSAAYRIVQESLTNVLRHAPGAPAAVRLCLEAAGLRIDVADDGGAAATVSGHVGGFGIQGMRERAALLGGALDAGPRGDGAGWRVSAWLPA